MRSLNYYPSFFSVLNVKAIERDFPEIKVAFYIKATNDVVDDNVHFFGVFSWRHSK